MRRAMRHAQLLGAREPLMWRLVPALVREMGQAYPELVRGEALITETLKLEETRFRKTLARGLGLLDGRDRRRCKAGDMLDGETAFKLYDTYGFPLDLTQDALRQRGISVDLDGFNDAMERQKAEARASWAGSGDAATETVWFDVREKTGATEFLGYDTEQAEGVVLALVKDGAVVDQARRGRRRRDRRQPDAVLWRIRRPDGRHRDDHRARASRSTSPIRRRRRDGLFVHVGKVVEGRGQDGRGRRAQGRSCAPLAAARQPFGDASAARGAARGARHPCRAEGFAGRARAPALRHLAPQADRAGGTGRGRAHGQRDRRAEQPGDDPADDRRRRDRRGRHGAVRREIRRRGARRVDGHGAAWREGRPALFGRTVRRHACRRHRRHRPGARGLRQRGRGRRAPHRGADRRGGAQPSRRAGPPPEVGGGDAEGRARRRVRPRRGAGRRAHASSSAN